MKTYDMVVIGAGSGGLTAAITARGFGKSVLLVDPNKPGGECTWSGCVPSKALIHEAQNIHTVKSRVKDFEYDSKEAMDHVRAVRQTVYAHETPEVLAESGIDFIFAKARFESSEYVRLDDTKVKGKRVIISTGSSPLIPGIPGLETVPYLTNDSFFDLERLPKRLIILGGGAIGTELAQAANRLGTTVDLIDMMPTLLFREEEAYAKTLGDKLSSEGVQLHLSSLATKVSSTEKGIRVDITKQGQKSHITADALLLALGRVPNITDLDLDAAGIESTDKGIKVNEYLQTSQPHIYAIGDVAGPYQFSHMANVQGIQAVKNAILPIKRKIRYDHVAWVTFTEPELARAGMTEAEATKVHGKTIRVYEVDFNDLDRTRTGGKSIEKMKLVLDAKGKVLGASILANRAGEMIGEIQLLKTAGINVSKLASVIHPYPTYGEVFAKIGKKVMVDNILNHPLVRLFRKKEPS